MAKQKKPGPAKKPEALKQTSKEFRLVSRDTEKMPVELSQAERDRCAVQLAELVEEKERLDEDKREVMREWRVKLRAKQEEIDDCAAGVIRGAKPTQFTIETRAVFKTRMIERVRTEDSKLIDKRPMTPEEEVQYLQTDIAERAQPAALLREPSTLVTNDDDALADEPDATDGDTLPDDECDAIRVPHGWPRAWMERRWKVEGAALPLTGADVAQVHCSLSSGGSTLDELCAEGAPAAYLGRPHVSRALALMLGRELVTTDDAKWFAKVEAPPAPTEPGRKDPLPEASAAPKPRRRRAQDTGEQAINAALGQSEAMEAGA